MMAENIICFGPLSNSIIHRCLAVAHRVVNKNTVETPRSRLWLLWVSDSKITSSNMVKGLAKYRNGN